LKDLSLGLALLVLNPAKAIWGYRGSQIGHDTPTNLPYIGEIGDIACFAMFRMLSLKPLILKGFE